MKTKLLGLLIFICRFATAQVNLSTSLIACYPLNGNGVEPINNLTGTLSSVTSTLDRGNNIMSALYFPGTANSFVELPNSPLLKPNAISFSAWVMGLPGTYPNPFILYTGTSYSTTTPAYSLAFVNVFGGKKFRVWKCNGGVTNGVATTTVQSDNVWYHVCFTMDNSAIKLYLNGTFQASVTTTLPFSYDAAKSVFLGSNNEPGTLQSFSGLIDNARFYDRILSPTEINQLYTSDPACVTATVPPVASFSTSNTSFCVGVPVQFWDQSLNYPTSWVWVIPGGTSTNIFIANPTYTFSSPGTYTVNLTASNGFGSSSASMAITVFPLPSVSVAASNTLVCRGTSLSMTASGAINYTWSTSQTGSQVVVYPNTTTNYTVTGADANGCRAQASFKIYVPIDCISIPEINLTGLTVSIYPNPFQDYLFMETSGSGNVSFKLQDLLGKELLSGNLEIENVNRVNLSHFSKGIYFLTFSQDSILKTIKIIKE